MNKNSFSLFLKPVFISIFTLFSKHMYMFLILLTFNNHDEKIQHWTVNLLLNTKI